MEKLIVSHRSSSTIMDFAGHQEALSSLPLFKSLILLTPLTSLNLLKPHSLSGITMFSCTNFDP